MRLTKRNSSIISQYCVDFPMSCSWASAKSTLEEIAACEDANEQSIGLATSILHHFCALGHFDAPVVAVDADGDIVLTWHRGRLKGSALITGDKFSSIVSDGARIAYLGQEKIGNELAMDSELLGLGGGGECQMERSLSASKRFTTESPSVGKYLYRTWQTSTDLVKADLDTQTSSHSPLTPLQGKCLSQSYGFATATPDEHWS